MTISEKEIKHNYFEKNMPNIIFNSYEFFIEQTNVFFS